MVKPNYTPLEEVNDQNKDIKVKVKVISKGEPKQTPPKRRYQKILLKDDEGTTMDGTIFGDDIEMFEQAIVKNGEYEFSNMVIKPVPESLRARAAADYQINFNSSVRITPLDLTGCSDEPQYRRLDKIPHSHSAEDDLIVDAAKYLYKYVYKGHDRIAFTMAGGNEQKSCDEIELFQPGRWISPPEAMQVYNDYVNKTPKPLIDMEKKKANTIWPDEKFWIQVSMSALEARDIHCYIGCSKCGKSSTETLGTKFVCNICHAKDAVAVTWALMNVVVYDKTGSMKVTAFANEVELIVGLKADQIAALKQSVSYIFFTRMQLRP